MTVYVNLGILMLVDLALEYSTCPFAYKSQSHIFNFI